MLAYQEISKLFSSRRVIELCEGDYSFLFKIASNYLDQLDETFTPADVYDACYTDLSKNYRGEYFYKNTVAEKILIGRHSLNTATAITEFRVGKSKADCVIINGHSTCYEIKSEFDNLDRLDNQLKHYQKIFDKVYIVTSSHHLSHILSRENANVGIIELTKRNNLKIVKEASIESREIEVSTLIRSLRVGEYTELVKSIYGTIPDVPNTEIFHECEKLLFDASPTEVRRAFCQVIKKTRKADAYFVSQLPKSLLMAGLSYKIPKSKQSSLIKKINTTISKETLCTTRS